MNGKKVISAVYPLANKIVSDLGYVLVDIEYKKQVSGMVLELFIDSENGITLNDCEKVSRAMDEPLDELNPTGDKAYILNVSSIGLDRPFKTDKDFNRGLGENVEVRLFKPLEKKKVYEGILVSFDSDFVIINVDSSEIKFERKNISKISKVINF